MTDFETFDAVPHSALTKLLKKNTIPHYYGDIVRRLFILAAVLMFLLMPVFSDRIPKPTWASIIAVIILVTAAGITNPKRSWTSFLNMGIAGTAVVLFGYYGILIYNSSHSYADSFFVVNQILAFLFLLAFYYSVKTVRGVIIKG